MSQPKTTAPYDDDGFDASASRRRVEVMATEALELLWSLPDEDWDKQRDVIDGIFVDHVKAELQRRGFAIDG